MSPAELLLRFQRQDQRARFLGEEIESLRARLATNADVERLTMELDAARATQQAAALRLKDVEREVEGHRAKIKAREKELMSGRVRNPSELIQMSEEVDHSKARLREEEEAEFEVMTTSDEADQEVARLTQTLAQTRTAWLDLHPGYQARIDAAQVELQAAEAEAASVWELVPAEYQAAYRRLSRLASPVAEVAGGQCGHCRVGLTASELQQVRRGDHIVHCQACSRLLVAV